MQEIERKFLIRDSSWRGGAAGARYSQGYLLADKGKSVRVRLAEGKAFLTIKSGTAGLTRSEFEYRIPTADAEELLAFCEGTLIEKTRYKLSYRGLVWEIDEFHGANDGLYIAEVELDREDQPVEIPAWIGDEVTEDPRYFNAYLAVHPFSTWSDSSGESD